MAIKAWDHRSVSVDEMFYNADGTIQTVKVTDEGPTAVKDSVTKIGIFGAMDTEVWVDDIEVFGYGIFDPYAPVVKKSVVRKEE